MFSSAATSPSSLLLVSAWRRSDGGKAGSYQATAHMPIGSVAASPPLGEAYTGLTAVMFLLVTHSMFSGGASSHFLFSA